MQNFLLGLGINFMSVGVSIHLFQGFVEEEFGLLVFFCVKFKSFKVETYTYSGFPYKLYMYQLKIKHRPSIALSVLTIFNKCSFTL